MLQMEDLLKRGSDSQARGRVKERMSAGRYSGCRFWDKAIYRGRVWNVVRSDQEPNFLIAHPNKEKQLDTESELRSPR